MISTSIFSIVFFLFVTVGSYKGIKLKDNIGKIKPAEIPAPNGLDFLPPGDGIIVFTNDILGAGRRACMDFICIMTAEYFNRH
jgi:hypothetical protein